VSVTAPEGFVASGVHAGVKAGGELDLSLVATADGAAVPAAGVFTTNLMAAAPVTVSRGHLRVSGGQSAAVVLNSGNANAGTGEPGCEDAETMCDLVAADLASDPHQVLVCSTGLIGNRLPIDVISAAIPGLAAARSRRDGGDAAEAIRTTDTVRKEVVVEQGGFVFGGMAKGAAMLAPNMATMLAVLTTDASADSDELLAALRRGIAESFNALTVDGATSTNDTVLLLASGARGRADPATLDAGVAAACTSLAEQMAADAEGATKVVRISVVGAHDDEQARRAARKVADSQLVKCSWYGNDPYWGRVASELGSAGVGFDQRLLTISYGDVEVCHAGVEVDHDRHEVARHMSGDRIEIVCDLGLGSGRGSILTNDLTHAYVDENMGTS
jgi:glutamate N-acetyltransferase / amino-acid N-acetyltransferase